MDDSPLAVSNVGPNQFDAVSANEDHSEPAPFLRGVPRGGNVKMQCQTQCVGAISVAALACATLFLTCLSCHWKVAAKVPRRRDSVR